MSEGSSPTGVITSYSAADAVGRIRLDDGTELRFGRTALRDVAPVPGARVRVESVGPHPLGGLRALAISPGEDVETSAARARQLADAAAMALQADLARHAATRQQMAQVTPGPLSGNDAAWLAKLRADTEARERALQDRIDRARHAAAEAADLRATRPARDALAELLRSSGLREPAVASAMDLVRDAALLVAAPAEAPLPSGASKFGGRPDLPAELTWPTHAGRSLAFLAQLQLADVPAVVRATLFLPATGLLSFFYDAAEQPWGGAPSDRGSAQVLYVPSARHLVVADGGPPYVRPELEIRYRLEPSPPDLRGPGSGIEDMDAYGEGCWRFRESSDVPRHLLGGFAEPIQDPMEADCARISGTSSEGAWRLLLQLDWDPAADMEWGDTGRLYFWVREADLQAGALDRAWCILQSH